MTAVLERLGSAYLRAFFVSFVFYATGILNAPDKAAAVALSIAALGASIVAGIRAVQIIWPEFSFSSLGIGQPYAAWLDSFSRAAVGSFLITITGWLAAPDLSTWKSVALAAVVGAVTAGVRALQGLLTKGEGPKPETGVELK